MQKNTAVANPVEELELDPILDENGNPVAQEDVLTEAERIDAITFQAGRFTYTARGRKLDVPQRLLGRLRAIQTRLALEAGFAPGEDIDFGADDEEFEATTGTHEEVDAEGDTITVVETETFKTPKETDPRLSALLIALDENEEITAIWADIAIAATKRHNVPTLAHPKPSREQLLNTEAGGAYVKAVRVWIRPTSTDSAAETETTPTVNTPEPSNTSPLEEAPATANSQTTLQIL